MTWRANYAGLVSRLYRARLDGKLRQVDVAERIGISTRHFARLEAAETDVSARTLFAWAAAVGLRVHLTNLSGDTPGAAE